MPQDDGRVRTLQYCLFGAALTERMPDTINLAFFDR